MCLQYNIQRKKEINFEQWLESLDFVLDEKKLINYDIMTIQIKYEFLNMDALALIFVC